MHAYSQVADSFGVMMPLEAWGASPFWPRGAEEQCVSIYPPRSPLNAQKKGFI